MNLALAMGQRVNGDPADNAEAAINALRKALEILPPEASPDLKTTIQVNLASSLLRRERGEKLKDLGEARELCIEVLKYRSLDRDPNEWAYVQLNLAPTLEQLATFGKADRSEAEAAYLAVIDAQDRLEDRHVGNAHYQLGRMLRIAAQFDPEEFVETWDADDSDEEAIEEQAAESTRQYEEARGHFESAAALLDAAQQPVEVGRVHAELADVLAQLDLEDEAIDAAGRGVELLPPASAPRDATRVGGRLGDLLSRKGEWKEAAAAFRVAVEAAELSFYSRFDREFRQREASSTINLTRWAAFALAAAGDIPEALMVLESGRAREMRQRLGLGEIAARELDELPHKLRTGYVEALDELAASPIGEASAAASRRLHEVLRDIREVSGFDQFGTRTHPADLVGALEPHWPLLYVNPTPWGTLLLLVEEDGDDATVDAYFLEEATSLEVLMRLLAGEGAESTELLEKEEAGSYLAGASGFGAQPRDLQKDVEHVLPWFGQSFSEPINDVLSRVGARGVTLVCCGPVGLAPLHAAPWNTEKGGQCLIDHYEIRYAPSGAFAAASLSRAAERNELPRSLVAIADPHGDLPSAQPEVEALSRHFGEQSSVAVGPEATWPFLVERAADATHVHLACHARSAVWGEEPPAVLLSDGAIDVAQLTELAELPSRLVAVSACQSAVTDISDLPEEAISIGSVLLAAGAACVVASLWPVRDDTTALLMNRLYEEMFENNLRPPEALRRAQVWVRDLTDAELDGYLREHPILQREFERRAALGDRAGNRAPAQEESGDLTPVRPFSAPTYWGPFIAIGA